MIDGASSLIGFLIGVGAWALKDLVAPDFLDVRRQRRAAELQREAEQRAQEREDKPVRDRVGALLLSELNALRRYFIGGQFSQEEWQHWHDQLKALIENTEGARALGRLYQDASAALSHDQLCINIFGDYHRKRNTSQDENSRRAQYEERQFIAHLREDVASAILQFIPIMKALGMPDANDYERSALQQVELSQTIYREMPPLG